MSIKDYGEKIKSHYKARVSQAISQIKSCLDVKEDVFIVLAIILIGLAGFGLGKLSALEKGREPVQITPAGFNSITSSTVKSTPAVVSASAGSQNQSATAMIAGESVQGLLVASKNGTKYHFPWCPGAAQITEKNKIWFNSYADAQKVGYTAASNCPGLK